MEVEVDILDSPSVIIPTEFRSCVKVEVAVLASPTLTVPTVSVDVKYS